MESSGYILKTNSKAESKTSSVFFQPKLAINSPGDYYEQEADAMAEKVMAKADPVSAPAFFSQSITSVQRKCAHCEEEEKLQRKENGEPEQGADIDSYVGKLSSAGEPLPNNQRSFFESRFGNDFSHVKIHTGAAAAKSAQSVGALAYTTGNHIVFNEGQYAPGTTTGDKLLAHELTHVIQQNGKIAPMIQRYSDTDHHIIEEVALSSIFSEAELKFIEQGNTGRDYSQLPSVGSGLLIGDPDLGGYKEHEHFDHFIFDREKDRWVSHVEFNKIWNENTKEWIERPVRLNPRKTSATTPLEYIESELTKAVEKDVPDSSSFIHVGNSFHTIEDFFAHSNFIELTKGDFSSGKELTTHPPGAHGPASTDSILSNVLDPAVAQVYKEKFNREYEKASPVSHGRMAKDFHINPNHNLAITLTALVIRKIGQMTKNAFSLKTKQERNAYLKNGIMAMLKLYLRPPDMNDKWWERLLTEDHDNTAHEIKTMQDKTPVTVNQVLTSPLRNLEATRFSSWKAIGLGTSVSIQLKDRTFFTAGLMLYAPGTGVSLDNKIFVAPKSQWDPADKPSFVYGAQVSGTFDLTDMLTKK